MTPRTKVRAYSADFGAVPMRALAVLYDNYNHLVSVTELRDRDGRRSERARGLDRCARERHGDQRVPDSAKPPGVNPENDIRKQSLSAAASVDAIKDDKIDAFFFSGGIPTGAILDLASTPGQDDQGGAERRNAGYAAGGVRIARVPQLLRSHPPPTPAWTRYRHGRGTVSNVLVVHTDMDEQLAYDLTRVLFEYHHDELAAVHPMAEILTIETRPPWVPPFRSMTAPSATIAKQGAWTDGGSN